METAALWIFRAIILPFYLIFYALATLAEGTVILMDKAQEAFHYWRDKL